MQARETFLATLLTAASVIPLGEDRLAATTDVVAAVTATPAELSPAAQALAVKLLQGVATSGAAVSPTVAQTAALGLSNVASAIVVQAALGVGAPGGEGGAPQPGGGQPAHGQAALLLDISGTVESLASSIHKGMLSVGEAPVAVSSPTIQFVAQIDARGAASRLFSAAGLALPDNVTRFALPPGLFGADPAGQSGQGGPASSNASTSAAGAVKTLLAGFAFNVYRPEDTLGQFPDSAGGYTAGSITRIRFTQGMADDEVKVQNLTRPVTFNVPAASFGAPGAGAVCRFWAPELGAFSTEGCAALPSPLPPGHAVEWAFGDLAGPAAAANAAPVPPLASAQPPAPPPPPLDPRLCRAEDGGDLYPLLRGAAARVLARGEVGPLWALQGPLMCGCKTVLIDCKADAAAAARAYSQALRQGATRRDAEKARDAARAKVYVSAARALLVPAVRCAENDTSTVMRVFVGDKCQARAAAAATATVCWLWPKRASCQDSVTPPLAGVG